MGWAEGEIQTQTKSATALQIMQSAFTEHEEPMHTGRLQRLRQPLRQLQQLLPGLLWSWGMQQAQRQPQRSAGWRWPCLRSCRQPWWLVWMNTMHCRLNRMCYQQNSSSCGESFHWSGHNGCLSCFLDCCRNRWSAVHCSLRFHVSLGTHHLSHDNDDDLCKENKDRKLGE